MLNDVRFVLGDRLPIESACYVSRSSLELPLLEDVNTVFDAVNTLVATRSFTAGWQFAPSSHVETLSILNARCDKLESTVFTLLLFHVDEHAIDMSASDHRLPLLPSLSPLLAQHRIHSAQPEPLLHDLRHGAASSRSLLFSLSPSAPPARRSRPPRAHQRRRTRHRHRVPAHRTERAELAVRADGVAERAAA